MRPRLLLLVAALLLLTGCSATSWSVEADEGTQDTHWNWGFEVTWESTLYIGPGRGSTTDVENKWTGAAEGEYDEPEPETETE